MAQQQSQRHKLHGLQAAAVAAASWSQIPFCRMFPDALKCCAVVTGGWPAHQPGVPAAPGSTPGIHWLRAGHGLHCAPRPAAAAARADAAAHNCACSRGTIHATGEQDCKLMDAGEGRSEWIIKLQLTEPRSGLAQQCQLAAPGTDPTQPIERHLTLHPDIKPYTSTHCAGGGGGMRAQNQPWHGCMGDA